MSLLTYAMSQGIIASVEAVCYVHGCYTVWFQELGHDFHKHADTKIIDKLSNSLANNGFKAKEERKKQTNKK